MKTRAICLAMLAIGLGVFVPVQAGDLEPPGPPAPTLLRIPAKVATTGQTGCWNSGAQSIPCAGTGQDGAYQAGRSVGPRFTDNGNGTVKDNLTDLIWLKNASCFGFQDWGNALSSSNTLASGACGLTDGSVAGAWRLPNVKELQSLIDFGHVSPPLPAGHPFSGVQSGYYYWSSTSGVSATGGPNNAWMVSLDDGNVRLNAKSNVTFAWAVRGGP